MSYRVELGRNAAQYLRRLGRADQERMARRLDQIAADPYGPHTKPLTNLAGRRAARVGDYRIVFTVDDDDKLVSISDIGRVAISTGGCEPARSQRVADAAARPSVFPTSVHNWELPGGIGCVTVSLLI